MTFADLFEQARVAARIEGVETAGQDRDGGTVICGQGSAVGGGVDAVGSARDHGPSAGGEGGGQGGGGVLAIGRRGAGADQGDRTDRKSTRLNSSHVAISYAVFCLKKKNMII